MYESRPEEAEAILSRFEITCRKCGSDDVVVHVREGWCGTDVTGGDPVELTLGCNACRANDYCLALY